MKKTALIIFIIVLILLVSICTYNLISIVFEKKNESNDISFKWIPEESHFVDYKITDNGTIKFRYSICFENKTNDDTYVSILADFSKKELKDWVEPKESFEGYDEKGNFLYAKIKGMEKKNIIFTFEGKYLGGKVNENLSAPKYIMTELSYE